MGLTEEEAIHLRRENAELRETYTRLKHESEQKDQRIEELEWLQMSARLRLAELERRLAKDSHNSIEGSLFPSPGSRGPE
ncbi:MAG TPA: hypothetical protein VFV38_51345 [Ktedonobacteraceae bacterium]|nr:hypothetical protein [Ktedonobacteraceae bacterium]